MLWGQLPDRCPKGVPYDVPGFELFSGSAGLAVEGIQGDTASITIIARAHPVEAACPACGKPLPPGPQPVCAYC
jgi:hypothetical protein